MINARARSVWQVGSPPLSTSLIIVCSAFDNVVLMALYYILVLFQFSSDCQSIVELHRVTVKPRLHDTTCCQTGLTTGYIVYTAGCQTSCTTRFDNRLNEQSVRSTRLSNRVCQIGCTTLFDNRLNEQCCSFNTVVKPVVKPVWQPIWQPVVSCKRGLNISIL